MLSWLRDRIRFNREQLEIDILHSPQRRYYSPIYYGQYCVTVPLMERYARGKLIDLGCGDSPFRDILLRHATEYHSLDLYPRNSGVTYANDIQDMVDVPDESYDTAVCLEVLEHVPDPFRAAREIRRILRPGGVLVLSVPHLSRLHSEPHDYFRYTRYGIGHVLKQANLEVSEIHRRGAVFTFLGHQMSTIILSLSWGIPGIRQAAWFLNKWLVTRFCWWIDGRLPMSEVLPAGYTLVAARQSPVDAGAQISEVGNS